MGRIFFQRVIPLQLAAKCGFDDVVGLLLGKSPKQVHYADASGYTSLHYAAIHGHTDMASMLLGQGAAIDEVDLVSIRLGF